MKMFIRTTTLVFPPFESETLFTSLLSADRAPVLIDLVSTRPTLEPTVKPILAEY
ncbi:hypothetical protein PGT21_026847 [Puccinia graminis f. sp. tritici]|uniref:Uncharacterized protein n=1 Tax=Puccinia graminis f. sp. tritici TaxID=56615 RepID=A0A5B0PGB8_PUCGR|nr:hypothetical protein PGT21_026847 [Puccinia graminis f. sp. tritici]KAA1100635.1 hypothetical protein PGTUg99_005022 [Puccinia graminis f. sp. tritici]